MVGPHRHVDARLCIGAEQGGHVGHPLIGESLLEAASIAAQVADVNEADQGCEASRQHTQILPGHCQRALAERDAESGRRHECAGPLHRAAGNQHPCHAAQHGHGRIVGMQRDRDASPFGSGDDEAEESLQILPDGIRPYRRRCHGGQGGRLRRVEAGDAGATTACRVAFRPEPASAAHEVLADQRDAEAPGFLHHRRVAGAIFLGAVLAKLDAVEVELVTLQPDERQPGSGEALLRSGQGTGLPGWVLTRQFRRAFREHLRHAHLPSQRPAPVGMRRQQHDQFHLSWPGCPAPGSAWPSVRARLDRMPRTPRYCRKGRARFLLPSGAAPLPAGASRR